MKKNTEYVISIFLDNGKRYKKPFLTEDVAWTDEKYFTLKGNTITDYSFKDLRM